LISVRIFWVVTLGQGGQHWTRVMLSKLIKLGPSQAGSKSSQG